MYEIFNQKFLHIPKNFKWKKFQFYSTERRPRLRKEKQNYCQILKNYKLTI